MKLKTTLSAILLALVLLMLAPHFPLYATHENEHSVIVSLLDGTDVKAFANGLGIKPDYEYSQLLCGFSARVDDKTLEKLSSHPLVESVCGEYEYKPLSSEIGETVYKVIYAPGTEPDNDPERGKGAVVAVLDDGFYLKSRVFSLSDDSAQAISYDDIKNNLHFTRAYYLYGNISADKVYFSEKLPFCFDYANLDAKPEPLSDHGTAMLSLAVANDPEGNIRSGAPAAQALAMKVYDSKTNSAKSSAIVAALEDAYILGADSVCLSLGAPCGYSEAGHYDSAVEKAIEKISALGVSVVCAAGNDGALGNGSVFDTHYGYFEPTTQTLDFGTVNAPSTLPEAISVASANDFIARAYAFYLPAVQTYIPYSDTNAQIVESGEKRFDVHFSQKTLEYLPIGGLGANEDYYVNGRSVDIKDKIALIKRGELSFVEKVNNAADMGAIAAVIYDNETTDTPSIRTAMQLEGARIPAIFISQADGERMLALEDKRIYVDPGVIYVTDAGITPSVSEDSSRGPTPTLDIKPELAAPADSESVLSKTGKYITMTGSSVSAAYTAGVAASVSVALEKKSAHTDSVKCALMNTSEPMRDKNGYYSVTLQGAGFISPKSAREADTLMYSESTGKILVGNELGESFDIGFTLENLSDNKQSYELSALIGTEGFDTLTLDELCDEKDSFYKQNGRHTYEYLGLEADDEISFVGRYIHPFKRADISLDGFDINVSADKAPASITLEPGERCSISLKVTLDKGESALLKGVYPDGMYIEGYVFAKNTVTEMIYSIPYLGFVGDFYAQNPFDSSLTEKGGLFEGVYLYTYFTDEYTDRMVILGTGEDTGSNYKKITPSGALSVISPVTKDGDNAIFLSLSLLRSLKKLRIEILNEAGECVSSRDARSLVKNFNFDKAYTYNLWNFKDKNNSKYIYDDGKYTCRIVGTDASEREFVRELDFYLDSEKPRYLSHTLRDDEGWELLDVTVSDNTFIKSVRAYSFNGNEIKGENNILSDDDMMQNGLGAKCTVSFDISRAAGQYVYLKICDLASNESVVRIDLGK